MVVFMPPKIHAKAKGIRNLEGCQFIFWHILKVIGKRIAKAPILFINDERIAAIKSREIKNWNLVKLLPPIYLPTSPVKSELFNPRLIINTRATVITAGWANPSKAWLAGITPRIINTTNAPAAKASYLNLLHINKPRRVIIVIESKYWSLMINI